MAKNGTRVQPGPGTTLPGQRNYIGGRFVTAAITDTFVIRHPGNDAVICEVEAAGTAEVDQAVSAANAAFPAWSRTPAAQRAEILRRTVAMLRERNDELAALETLDTGKPIAETRTVDIVSGMEVLEYYAGIAPSIAGQHIDLPPNAFAVTRREPLGVCAGIGAWNYPIQIALWKSAPALACGNTMVYKPAEETPLTTLKLAEIYTEAGLPPGVFNVVLGAANVGAALVGHPQVEKISFTGSAETGRHILVNAAHDFKKVTLELGGKSPIIVFDDADPESALNAVLGANFFSSGQVCSNGTRVFIQDTVHDELLERLKERTSAIRIGNPFDPDTQVGPLVSRDHRRNVLRYMAQAKESSARHICGGEALSGGEYENGYYVSPAIFAACEDDMSFVREEVFGPLMSVLSFSSEEEVVRRANATHFGLSGAVFTKDFSRAHRVANGLQAGTVWINEYNVTPASAPFGGYKHSGLGRENGLQAIEHYTQIKTVYANLGSVPRIF